MPSALEIRPETPDDQETLYRLTKAAFAPMPFSDGKEADCLNQLRADGDLALSLVASREGSILGHVAFSPVRITEAQGQWMGLGPVSVWPDHQRSGIGSALITEGLERLRAAGVAGCALIGAPRFYARFGFRSEERLTYRDLRPELVQWLAFSAPPPTGRLLFSPGLQ